MRTSLRKILWVWKQTLSFRLKQSSRTSKKLLLWELTREKAGLRKLGRGSERAKCFRKMKNFQRQHSIFQSKTRLLKKERNPRLGSSTKLRRTWIKVLKNKVRSKVEPWAVVWAQRTSLRLSPISDQKVVHTRKSDSKYSSQSFRRLLTKWEG